MPRILLLALVAEPATAAMGDSRVSIAELDLADAEISATKKTLSIGNVGVALSETAAGALNAAFGTDAFKPGLKLGAASVKTRILRAKKK